jgi:hypothetical protein
MGMRCRLHVCDAHEFLLFLLARGVMQGKLDNFRRRLYTTLTRRRGVVD